MSVNASVTVPSGATVPDTSGFSSPLMILLEEFRGRLIEPVDPGIGILPLRDRDMTEHDPPFVRLELEHEREPDLIRIVPSEPGDPEGPSDVAADPRLDVGIGNGNRLAASNSTSV